MMTVTTERAQLDLIEKKRQSVLDAMGRIRERFVAQVAAELPGRWEQIVRDQIAARPYRVKALGLDDLSRMKHELRDLQERAEEMATRHMSGPNLWKHNGVGLDESGYQAGSWRAASKAHSRQRWPQVSQALADAEHEVAHVLRPLVGDNGAPGFQSRRGKLSAPLEQMMAGYDRLLRQLEQIEGERGPLSRRIAAEEARELWESA